MYSTIPQFSIATRADAGFAGTAKQCSFCSREEQNFINILPVFNICRLKLVTPIYQQF
jgi:hypothetical protein